MDLSSHLRIMPVIEIIRHKTFEEVKVICHKSFLLCSIIMCVSVCVLCVCVCLYVVCVCMSACVCVCLCVCVCV